MSTSNRPTPAVLVAVVVIVLVGAAAMSGAASSFQGFSLGGADAPWSASSDSGTVVVDDVDAPSKIWTGDDLAVSVVVSNTGDLQATRNVTLHLDVDGDGSREVAGEQSVTVGGGATESVTFDVPSGENGLAEGTHAYRVETGDDVADGSISFSILRPAMVTVTETVPQEPVVAGEPATMTVAVENQGDFRAGRLVGLAVDVDGDGEFAPGERFGNATVNVDPRSTAETTLALPTEQLTPGTYDYQVSVRDESTTGQLTVVEPAAFEVSNVTAPAEFVRGDVVNVTARVTNTGDVAGTGTVRVTTNATGGLSAPVAESTSSTADDANDTGDAEAGPRSLEQTVQLASGESTTVQFTVSTENLTRGNYSVGVAAPDHEETTTVRVREPFFAVSSLETPRVDPIGEEYPFVATVENTGDANGTQLVEFRIDVDDDDVPEPVDINQTLTLASGEEVRVEFMVQTGHVYPEDPIIETLDRGTYVYGVFTEDDNETTTVTFRDSSSSSSSSSDDDDTGEDYEVTRNEIAQTKYGVYYVDLSHETRVQVDEIATRQPFADGVTMADVETREEIAARLGYDDGKGAFVFHEDITVEQQQTVEAEFDAQFEGEAGDRIESWDELARTTYGTSFDALNETQQEDVRDRYQEQF